MCRGVANVLGATVACLVRLNASSQECTVVCWPQPHEPVTLRYVTRETCSSIEPQTSLDVVRRWRRTIAFGILRDLVGEICYAEVQLAAGQTEDRLAVFARHERFHEVDFRLLTTCEEPLAAIDGHVLRLEAATTKAASPPFVDVSDRPPAHNMLTRREIEVLTLLEQGLKARSMAGRLGVAPRTVNKHLGNLYRKLDAHDRLMAVSRAQSLGILPTH